MQTRTRAFTLIEVLVVIAIIGVLIGVLLPSLAAARATAQTGVCMSNQRQIMIATLGYVRDHDDRIPSAGSTYDPGGAHAGWFFALDAYLTSDVTSIARCPGDDSRFWEQPFPGTDKLRRVSYGTNFFLSGKLPSYEAYAYMSALWWPERTILPSELVEATASAISDHFHPELWLIDPPTKAAEQLELTRHNGRCVWAHFDGHAEALTLDDVYRLDPDSEIGDLKWHANRLDPRIGH